MYTTLKKVFNTKLTRSSFQHSSSILACYLHYITIGNDSKLAGENRYIKNVIRKISTLHQ